MNKLIVFALVCILIVGSFGVEAKATGWADTYYTYLEQTGILNADFGQDLSTDSTSAITREEFFALVVSALYGAQAQLDTFADFADFGVVTPSFSGYIKAAYESGILAGVFDDGFLYCQPSRAITRQEAAAVLGRALNLSSGLPPEFTDADDIADWANVYTAGCEQTAVFVGYPDGTFRPYNEITWGESVKIIAYAMQNHLVTPPPITLVGGNSSKGHYNGTAVLASFNAPSGVLVNAGTIYIADTDNNLIRQIKAGNVSAFAGKAVGYDTFDKALNGLYNKDLETSLFARPTALLQTKDGLLVLDSENHCIRLISGGKVTIFAGTGKAGKRDGSKASAQFNAPQDICADEAGNIYIADTGNNALRVIDTKSNVLTLATLNAPAGIAYADGVLYVTSSYDNKIYSVKDGMVNLFAGDDAGITDDAGNSIGAYRDGMALRAYFSNPTGICVSTNGTVYIADTGNGAIRQIKDSTVTTLVGGGKTADLFVMPRGLYLDGDMLYVTDSFRHTISRIEVK